MIVLIYSSTAYHEPYRHRAQCEAVGPRKTPRLSSRRSRRHLSGLGIGRCLELSYQACRSRQLSAATVPQIIHTMSTPDPLPHRTPQGHVSPPTTYTVGRHRTYPLVRAQHLRGHLALLHAFDTLRRDVESGDVSRFPPDVRIMDAETRWGWFVSLAVER